MYPKLEIAIEKAFFLIINSTVGCHQPLAQVSKAHFILSLENTNTTRKTVALKGWHLNLEIENKYK